MSSSTHAVNFKPALHTALHEAGHACMLLFFGLPFGRVTVLPGVDSLGEIDHPGPMGIEHSGVRERTAIARQIVLVAKAGLQAQQLVDPYATVEQWASSDYQNAFEVSREYRIFRGLDYFGSPTHFKRLERLEVEARRLVRKRLRPAIELLAGVLMERLSLTMVEAEEIVKGVLPCFGAVQVEEVQTEEKTISVRVEEAPLEPIEFRVERVVTDQGKTEFRVGGACSALDRA
jgi:hypothetical protein